MIDAAGQRFRGRNRGIEGTAEFIKVPTLGGNPNVQQLTCNIDLSNYSYCLFFSFVLIEPKPFVLKGKVLGEKV